MDKTYINVFDVLMKKYSILKIDYSEDFTSNEKLSVSLKESNFVTTNILYKHLDLSSVMVLTFSTSYQALAIPVKNKPNQSLVIGIQNNEFNILLLPKFVSNEVSKYGTGWITIVTEEETWSDNFEQDIHLNAENNRPKKSCFRKCFDKAYDDVCDGFLGCVAWYTNPGIAVVVAAGCGVMCEIK
ncbi:MAG: hypothetical protein NTY55_01025 [Flavobacteriia bacterium]|jgi:hypothetical protein|nr:hypothetical protein [Flavobacteriia bacterium]